MKTKLVGAINDQICAEFKSAYLYLAMAAWFTENNLPGFAHWMKLQWQEETQHAIKLYDFLHSRGASVTLQAMDAPKKNFKAPLEIFEQVRKHEIMITERINALYELAVVEKDYPLQIVLQWFINEQVEEESQVMEIVERLKLIGSDGPSIYLFDRQLAGRATTASSTTKE